MIIPLDQTGHSGEPRLFRLAHVHERHQLGRHDDERSHHVAVFVLEDVAVVHVAPAEDLEADDDVDDLVRIDADGVLQAELVVVERVRDAVLGRVAKGARWRPWWQP